MKLDRLLLSEIYSKTNGCCYYCGIEIPPFSSWEVEHMLPRSRGGEDGTFNLVPSCRPCNNRKGARTVEEYRKHLSVKLSNMLTIAFEYSLELPLDYDVLQNAIYQASQDAAQTRIIFYGERYRNGVLTGLFGEIADAQELETLS